jgi:hypothetical protein
MVREFFHNYSLDKKAIPMAQVMALVHTLENKGFPRDVSLRGTGIDPMSDDRVSYRQRIAQLERMIELTGLDGAWLESPRMVSISDYGLLGYAMMSSATLEQAIQIAAKYHRMAGAMFELKFELKEGEAVLRIEHLLPGGAVGQFVVEELFIGIVRLIGLLLGEEHKPSRILLNYPAPQYLDKYESHFGCPVVFSSAFCEYRFDRTELSKSLAEADANTARICEESCRKLFNHM